MAAQFALDHEERVTKLILIAPALTIEGFESAVKQKLQIPVILYHGVKDSVVDPYAVKIIAEKTKLCISFVFSTTNTMSLLKQALILPILSVKMTLF